jgi:uncharacterized protein (TIGR02453 family)
MKAIIPASTFEFLNELRQNNHKEWMDANRKRYRASEDQLKSFFTAVMEGLKREDEIARMKIFRINRDIRFSKDKTPYNIHRSVQYSRAGAQRRGGYYFRLQPGSSFMAGGFFQPEPADLLRIRKEFEMDSEPMRKILEDKSFNKAFGGFSQEYRVKTSPKGFDKGHPDIDLIRLKSYFVTHAFSDQEVLAPDFADGLLEHFSLLRPFFDYMSEVLTTDLNGVSLLED